MAAASTSEYGTAEDDIRKLPSICPTATFAMVYLIDELDARARGCVCGFGYLIDRLLFFLYYLLLLLLYRRICERNAVGKRGRLVHRVVYRSVSQPRPFRVGSARTRAR